VCIIHYKVMNLDTNGNFQFFIFLYKKMEIDDMKKWTPIQQKIGHMEEWYVQPYNMGSGDWITLNPSRWNLSLNLISNVQ
jgi:hypothetical protein